MIRYLAGEEKKMCRELWEEAFPEDSREFGDYYFREKLKDNRILALTEEDKREPCRIDAMIHRNPYPLMVRGRLWKADYLVGVATRREKRHRGYMRQLLLRMMEDMRQAGMPFCFLMPADEAIYRPFGFTYIFRQPQYVLKNPDLLTRKNLLAEPDPVKRGELLGEAADWTEEWLSRHYQVYARRDMAYFRRLADELASEEGTLEILCDGDKIAGVMSWWGRKEREQRLLYGDKPYVERTDALGKPAIMARIISPETFISAIHLRKGERHKDPCTIWLRIRDPLICANDGLWLWRLDEESSRLEKVLESETNQQERAQLLDLTIEQLTSWLFGYQTPKAAEAYGDLIETLQDVFLDEVV